MLSYEPLQKIMIEKSITVRELASMCGLNKSTISGLFNGQTSVKTETIEKICNALHCSISDIVITTTEPVEHKRTAIRKSHGIKVNWDKIYELGNPVTRLSEELGFKSNYLTLRRSRNAGLPEEVVAVICEKYNVSKEFICE